MPIEEGQNLPVDQTGEASTTGDAPKPESDTSGKPAARTTNQPGNSTGQNEDYERRFKGITADLQAERKARQQFEKDLAAARAEVEQERKRVRALSGIETKSPQDAEDEEIKARLGKLGVPTLSQEDLDAIKEVRRVQAEMAATVEHHWIQHGRGMVNSLYSAVEKEIGGTLTPRQKSRIQSEYVREVSQNPEFADRHEAGDPELVAELAKQLAEDWFEPARRKVTQQEAQRYRAVPSGKDRGIVTHGQTKIDVNDPKAVEDFLVKSYREKNGEFKGRR